MSEPEVKKSKMASALDQLKEHTIVVADTGDFEGNSVLKFTCMSLVKF